MSYFRKTPNLVQYLFPSIVWKGDTNKNRVHLTFDDGPDPLSTPILLDILDQHNTKAIFFCTGSKVEANPDLYKSILARGHLCGNHGYHHLSGWFTSKKTYLENVEKGARVNGSSLFRPPYGQITFTQYLEIKKKYQIVMWNFMPGDFDPKVTSNKLLGSLIKSSKCGTLCVLHDRPDCIDKLTKALPLYLQHLSQKGMELGLPYLKFS